MDIGANPDPKLKQWRNDLTGDFNTRWTAIDEMRKRPDLARPLLPALELLLGSLDYRTKYGIFRLLAEWGDHASLLLLRRYDAGNQASSFFRTLLSEQAQADMEEAYALAHRRDPAALEQIKDIVYGLLGSPPLRLRSLNELTSRGQIHLVLPMLDILLGQDPDMRVRRSVLDALAECARTHPEARPAIDRAAIDASLPDALRQKAARHAQWLDSLGAPYADMNQLDDLRQAIASGSQTPSQALLARAQSALDAPTAALADRLRQEAIRESRNEYQAALLSQDPGAISLAQSRLQAQLDGAQGAMAPGSNALAAASWSQAWHKRFQTLLIQGYPLSIPLLVAANLLSFLPFVPFFTLPYIPAIIIGAAIPLLAAALILRLQPAYRTKARIAGFASVHAFFFLALLALFGLFQPIATAPILAFLLPTLLSVKVSAPGLNQIIANAFGLLRKDIRALIQIAAPKDLSDPWLKDMLYGLQGTARTRTRTIDEMLRHPEQCRSLVDVVMHLLDDPAANYQIVELLGKWGDAWRLKMISASPGPQASHARQVLASLEAAKASAQDLDKLNEIVSRAPAVDLYSVPLAQAEAVLQQVPQSLSKRLRQEAIRESRDELKAALARQDAQAAALALARLQAQLDGAQGAMAPGSNAIPSGRLYRIQLWLALHPMSTPLIHVFSIVAILVAIINQSLVLSGTTKTLVLSGLVAAFLAVAASSAHHLRTLGQDAARFWLLHDALGRNCENICPDSRPKRPASWKIS